MASTLGARALDRIPEAGVGHPISYAAALVLVAVTAATAEISFADFEHGTHLFVLLIVVIGLAVLRGPGPGTLALLVGGAASGAASLGNVEPPDHPDTAVQLAMYLLVGVAFVLLIWLTSEARRRRLLMPARTSGSVWPHAPLEPLTAREQEILRLAATGISVDDIARALFVSPNTVKTHLTHTYAKLGARGRADAVRVAMHLRYLTADDICPHLRQQRREEPRASR